MQSITVQNKKLKEIAFIQSHELRRPVANILGLAELIPSIEISEDDKNIIDMLKHVAADLDTQIRNVVALSQSIATLEHEYSPKEKNVELMLTGD
jgi:signal transduction histidine kinase